MKSIISVILLNVIQFFEFFMNEQIFIEWN